jgi:hypothetical protein
MSMRWWRTRRKGLVGLALVALMLQLCLSFGHVHVRDPLTRQALVTTEIFGKAPASGSHGLPGDNDCPICRAIFMTASGELPAPPAIATAAHFAFITRQAFVEQRHFGSPRHFLFQTRAPPIG